MQELFLLEAILESIAERSQVWGVRSSAARSGSCDDIRAEIIQETDACNVGRYSYTLLHWTWLNDSLGFLAFPHRYLHKGPGSKLVLPHLQADY